MKLPTIITGAYKAGAEMICDAMASHGIEPEFWFQDNWGRIEPSERYAGDLEPRLGDARAFADQVAAHLGPDRARWPTIRAVLDYEKNGILRTDKPWHISDWMISSMRVRRAALEIAGAGDAETWIWQVGKPDNQPGPDLLSIMGATVLCVECKFDGHAAGCYPQSAEHDKVLARTARVIEQQDRLVEGIRLVNPQFRQAIFVQPFARPPGGIGPDFELATIRAQRKLFGDRAWGLWADCADETKSEIFAAAIRRVGGAWAEAPEPEGR